MSAENASPPSGKCKCPQCSATNPADADLCYLCGTSFRAPEEKTPPAGPKPAAAPAPQPPPGGTEDQLGAVSRGPAPRGARRGPLVALLVVVALAIGGGVWWKSRKPGEGSGEGAGDGKEAPALAPVAKALLAPAAPAGGVRPSPFYANSPPVMQTAAVGLGKDLHDLAYTPDGRFLVGAGYGGFKVRLWDGLSGKELQHIIVPHRPESLAVAPGGGAVFVADVSGFLVRYPLHPSGRLGWSRRHRAEGLKHIYVAISPNGRLAATCAWKQLAVLDARSFAVLAKVEMSEQQRRLAFSPGGRLLVLSSMTNKFTVWDLETGKGLTYTIPRVSASSDVGSLAFSPDGKLLATGHMDSSITVWDMQKRAPLQNFYVPQRSTRKVAFSPAGGALATAQQGGDVHLWEPRTARQLAVLKGHAKSARLLAFHPGGRRLASCGEDGKLLFWDTGEIPRAAAKPAPAGELLAWNLEQLPEAKPLADALRAMKTNDLALFKTVFSRENSTRFAKLGWQGAVKALEPAWKKPLGSMPVGHVHVEFEGASARGVLRARAGLRKIMPAPVVREGRAWKIDLPPPGGGGETPRGGRRP